MFVCYVDQDTLKEMCADDSLQLSDISNFFLRGRLQSQKGFTRPLCRFYFFMILFFFFFGIDSNGRETKITDLHHLDLSKIERRYAVY